MDDHKPDYISITSKEAPPFSPRFKYKEKPLRSADFEQATLEAAKGLLQMFEMRFAHQHVVFDVMDVVSTAQKLIDRKLVQSRRAKIRSI